MAILENGLEFDSPMMNKVYQHFDPAMLDRGEIRSVLQKQIYQPHIRNSIRPKMKIALAVGSRGIRHLSFIVRTVIEILHDLGASPIIVPAMGSHGGGTPEGQRNVLSSYGITEETMGVPIDPSMETLELGEVQGVPIHFSKAALESDLIIPICRIKPHTDFKGPIESGVYKMLSIGLGKHKGAASIHRAGFPSFSTLIPGAGQFITDHAPVVFSVAVVENSYDEVENIYVIPKDRIAMEEPKLLAKAKSLLAKINISPIDFLIVDQIGKDISGEGMDPNVTGRSVFPVAFEDVSAIKRIAVLDLTEETHGNATGIGMADLTTMRCFKKINLQVTYANVITAGLFGSAKMPLLLENDREVLAVGLKSATLVAPQQARVVRIKNTLQLTEFWVSEAIINQLLTMNHFTITDEKRPFTFDSEGNLDW
ncbi:lactate racemase domain-containing protein [Ammoniphilus sp. 3BR4]|uniref:lactate racemase domain-containing protein n=1 Tax=Ammoniphilus sp. 3BR4 TaxID=3158265 RepID=UPI00346732DC